MLMALLSSQIACWQPWLLSHWFFHFLRFPFLGSTRPEIRPNPNKCITRGLHDSTRTDCGIDPSLSFPDTSENQYLQFGKPQCIRTDFRILRGLHQCPLSLTWPRNRPKALQPLDLVCWRFAEKVRLNQLLLNYNMFGYAICIDSGVVQNSAQAPRSLHPPTPPHPLLPPSNPIPECSRIRVRFPNSGFHMPSIHVQQFPDPVSWEVSRNQIRFLNFQIQIF